MPPKALSKPIEYPYKVKGRSSHATVYRVLNRSRAIFTVVWYSGGKRQKKSLSSENKALDHAARVLSTLDKGHGQALELSATDRDSYVAAMGSLAPFSLPLHSAMSDYVEALKILKGKPLLPAVRFFIQAEIDKLPPCTVPELFSLFMVAKELDGVSKRYLDDCRSRLGRFSRDFTGQISNIKTVEIDTWLRNLGKSVRNRNNFRILIVALFNFAKASGYLPKTQETEADWTAVGKKKPKDILTFTNEEMEKLLKYADERILPYLVLGGFAGLRTAEIERITWEDINWKEKSILVNKDNKTGRRFAPLLNNAALWLTPCKSRKGKIITGFKLQLAQEQLAAAAEVTWKRNALRHSFASNRYRILHDVQRLAIEMGNSVSVIESCYHNLTSELNAKAYFALVPGSKVEKPKKPKKAAKV